MGRGTRRARRSKQSDRPSLLFIIALAVGLLLLAWAFFSFLSNPPREKPPLGGVHLTEPALG